MRAVIAVVALLFSGCSLILDWDSNGGPCAQSDPQCPDSFSCAFTTCVADGTLVRGEECSADGQCQPGLDCKNARCTPPCGGSFYQANNDGCLADEYCAPFPDEEDGFCVPSQCQRDDDCTVGTSVQTCVQIKLGAGACFSTCEIERFVPDYVDSCVSEPGGPPVYCQPIGRDDPSRGARLVCFDANTLPEAGARDTTCNPVLTPCQARVQVGTGTDLTTIGLTCDLTESTPRCRQLCDPIDNNCGENEICCPREIGQARYAVCVPDCN